MKDMENNPGKRNLVETSSPEIAAERIEGNESTAHNVNELVQLVTALLAGEHSRLPELLNYPKDMLYAVLQDRNLDIDGDGNVVTRDMNVGDESVVGSHNVIISIKEESPHVAAQLAGVSAQLQSHSEKISRIDKAISEMQEREKRQDDGGGIAELQEGQPTKEHSRDSTHQQAFFLSRVLKIPHSSARRLVMIVFFFILPLVIITGILAIFRHWHVPTKVQINLVSRRALFTIGKLERDSSIMRSVDFQSITIERFSNIKLRNVDVFVPEQQTESTEHSIVRNIPVMEIEGQEEFLFPSVTIETEQTTSSGNVENIRVREGSQLLMEFGDIETADNIIIQVDDQQSEGDARKFFIYLSLSGAFHLLGKNIYVSGIETLPAQKDLVQYNITKIANPIEVVSQPSSLLLTISPDKNTEFFEKEYPLPISALDFTYLDDRESRLNTTLAAGTEGYISYPDFPGIPARTFDASNFIAIDPLDDFQIVEMVLDTHNKGFRFLLEGMVENIRTKSKKLSDEPKDHRLTRFDILTHPNSIFQWEVWCCILVWGAMGTVGWYVLSRMGHT
jgi:hypothetical protein